MDSSPSSKKGGHQHTPPRTSSCGWVTAAFLRKNLGYKYGKFISDTIPKALILNISGRLYCFRCCTCIVKFLQAVMQLVKLEQKYPPLSCSWVKHKEFLQPSVAEVSDQMQIYPLVMHAISHWLRARFSSLSIP